MKIGVTSRDAAASTLCLVVCLASAAVTSCATGDEGESEPEPVYTRPQVSLHEAVEEADERAEEQNTYEVPLRYNAPHCGAPSFEVRIYGRWTRVFLEGDETTVNALQQVLTADDMSSALLRVTARGLVVDDRKTSSGLSYPVFELQSFDPPDSGSDDAASDEALSASEE